MLISYGDLLFRGYILEDLLESPAPMTIVVDSLTEGSHISGSPDYAYCSAPDDRSMLGQDVNLIRVSDEVRHHLDLPCGRWIGLLRVGGEGRQWLERALAELQASDHFQTLGIPDLLNHLVQRGHTIKVQYINGHWLDVNTLDDLDRAGSFTRGHEDLDPGTA